MSMKADFIQLYEIAIPCDVTLQAVSPSNGVWITILPAVLSHGG